MGNQEQYIEVGYIMQWPEEEDKQWPKNHYTENKLKSEHHEPH
jgi:hypothetical protein